MHINIKLLFLGLSILFGLKSPLLAQSGLEEEALAIHEKKFRWLETKQVDSLEALLHEDIQYVHSNAWRETKSEVIENIKTDHLTYRKVTIESASANAFSHTVVVNGRALFEVALDGRPIDIYLDYIEVYLYSEDRWQLISRHSCKIPE